MSSIAEPSVVGSRIVIRFGDFHLHSDGTLFHFDRQIHLTPKELAALRFLLRNAGKLLSAAQIQQELWRDVHVTADSVPRCISALRARLGPDSCIQTIYKQGYRLSARVREDAENAEAPLARLAIMPFTAGPGVPDHLGSAVAEDATAQLTARQPRIYRMLARDSVFMLASRGMSAQQAGETLSANLVLTGTIHALPVHFRLRAEMVQVADGTQMWVEDFLVAREQIAELSPRVVERLTFRAGCRDEEAGVSGEEQAPAGEKAQEIAEGSEHPHAESYELLLRGRHEWQSLERHRMDEGVRHIQRAAEVDAELPQWPLEMVRATVAREMFGFVEPGDAARQVRNVAQALHLRSRGAQQIAPALAWMALHVDRNLQEAHKWADPEGEWPRDSWSMRMGALIAVSRHRFDEACGILEHAFAEDPYSPWIGGGLAWTHHLAGHWEESAQQIRRCLELAPDHAASQMYGGIVLAYQGEMDAALKLTEAFTRSAPQLDLAVAVHAYVLACAGRREEAEEHLERLQWLSRERYVMRSFSAAAYAALGDTDSALAELAAANESRCPWFLQMLADPRLNALRDRTEFHSMVALVEEMEDGAGKEQATLASAIPAGTAR